MPIRKEFRHLYSGPEWKRTRTRILKRAGYRCEFCGRPNRKLILVTLGGEWWDEGASCWRDAYGCFDVSGLRRVLGWLVGRREITGERWPPV